MMKKILLLAALLVCTAFSAQAQIGSGNRNYYVNGVNHNGSASYPAAIGSRPIGGGAVITTAPSTTTTQPNAIVTGNTAGTITGSTGTSVNQPTATGQYTNNITINGAGYQQQPVVTNTQQQPNRVIDLTNGGNGLMGRNTATGNSPYYNNNSGTYGANRQISPNWQHSHYR